MVRKIWCDKTISCHAVVSYKILSSRWSRGQQSRQEKDTMCKNILFYLQLWFEREAAVEHANVCISAKISSTKKFLGFFVPSFTFDQQNIDLILVLPNLAWNGIQISYLSWMG